MKPLLRFTAALLVLMRPALLSAQSRITPVVDSAGNQCSAGAGGGVMLSSRATAVYTLEFGKDSATLSAAIIARSQDGWRGFYGATGPIPPKPRGSFDLGGGTVDTLWLLMDTENRTAWIHTNRVPFGTDNVLLVDRIDGVGGPPKEVGTVRVPDKFGYRYQCQNGRILQSPGDSVRALLIRDSRIRDFVRP